LEEGEEDSCEDEEDDAMNPQHHMRSMPPKDSPPRSEQKGTQKLKVPPIEIPGKNRQTVKTPRKRDNKLDKVKKDKRDLRESRDQRESKELRESREPLSPKNRSHFPNLSFRGKKLREENGKPKSTTGEWRPKLDLRIVILCCDYIEQHRDVEGVFRMAGSAVAQKRLYPTFALPEHVNLADEHCHDVACTFKHWLRHLTTPIFPYEVFDEALATLEQYQSTEDVSLLVKLIGQLPPDHYVALHRILQLLKNLADNAAVNKMPALNLSIVFGPTLLPPIPVKDTSMAMTMLDSQDKTSGLIHALLNHYEQLYIE